MKNYANWYSAQDRAVFGDWPNDESGEPIPPVLLKTVSSANDELAILRSLLESFGIPNVCRFPKELRVTPVVIGAGVVVSEIYVPETMLEDAKNIINTDNIDFSEEEN